MSEKLLRRSEVENRVGLGRSQIYQQIKLDRFPAPIKVAKRAVRWIESEIDQWISERIEAGRGAER